MTNGLLTDLGLSIPPKLFFENFIDECFNFCRTQLFIDNTLLKCSIFCSYLSYFHRQIQDIKSFGKHETGSMFYSPENPRCVQHMSAWSLRNTLAFRSDYDFQTVFKLLDYSSIHLNCCINT